MKTLIALALLATQATAGIVYQTYSVPPAQSVAAISTFGVQTGSWQAPIVPVTVAPFDTALGTLTEVEVFFNYQPSWLYIAENTTAVQGTQNINWARNIQMNVVYRPGFTGPVEWDYHNTVGDRPSSVGAQGLWPVPLAPFDGTLDFTGPSGLGLNYGNGYIEQVTLHETNPRALVYWTSPGNKTFYLAPRFLSGWESGFPSHIWYAEDDIRCNISNSVLVKFHYQ